LERITEVLSLLGDVKRDLKNLEDELRKEVERFSRRSRRILARNWSRRWGCSGECRGGAPWGWSTRPGAN